MCAVFFCLKFGRFHDIINKSKKVEVRAVNNLLMDIALFLKKIHDFIASITHHLNDKALHFLVLGFTGLIILGVTYPMFKLFDKRDNSFAMASVYTGTILVILAIAMAAVQYVTVEEILLLLLFGVIIFLVSYQIFKYLDRRNQALRITNFFTTTMIVIFAIGIEICQGMTKTGKMELADSLFGIAGYVIMYLVIYVIARIAKLLIRKRKNSKSKKDQ